MIYEYFYYKNGPNSFGDWGTVYLRTMKSQEPTRPLKSRLKTTPDRNEARSHSQNLRKNSISQNGGEPLININFTKNRLDQTPKQFCAEQNSPHSS